MKNLLTLFICLLGITASAQQKLSWKQHLNMADDFYKNALYTDAAEHYEAAWRQKPKKLELIHKAAESYFIIKDYKKAANAYKNIKDEGKKYPMAGLRYARSLKQDGNYDEASREFVYFLNNYNGDDKALITEIVQNEIRGCELGIKLSAEPLNNGIQVLHLNSNVNSPETEFAPIPFNDNVLYFSSTMSNKARIYFTMREKDGDWKKSTPPKNFPDIPNDHFCNGTLTPDSKRFYFTLCKSVESWGGLTTRCEINVIKKIGDTWTTPQRLRDYINLDGTTATHPFVIHKDGKEILYFASNREGSIGGMDLWYVERNVDSEDIDFTFPVNLGPQINTLGDEITPFYDQADGVLYFSSNGHATLGGQDIFKSKGSMTNWAVPENAGLPYNSSADDYYFVKTPSRAGGFLTSNRIFGMEKITTTHEDLFEFRMRDEMAPAIAEPEAPKKTEEPVPTEPTASPTEPTESLKVAGKVIDKFNDEVVPGVTVSLYEITSDKGKRLLTNKNAEDGRFEFTLLPNRNFMIEAQKNGYSGGMVEFSTSGGQNLTEDIFIARTADNQMAKKEEEEMGGAVKEEKPPVKINTSPKPDKKVTEVKKEATPPIVKADKEDKTKPVPPTKKETLKPMEPQVTTPQRDTGEIVGTLTAEDLLYEGSTYIARGRSPADRSEFKTDAPRYQGEYYKIQLIAVDHFTPEEERFTKATQWGTLQTEYLIGKKLYRVLLSEFPSLDEAKQVLKEVQSNGFGKAFIVRYNDGERYGMVYR